MRKLLFILLFVPSLLNAITPVFTCGFECGAVAAVGNHITGAGGTNAISTSTFRTGLRSAQFNESASSGTYDLATLTSSNIWIIRLYVNFSSLPATNNAGLVFVTLGGFPEGAYFNISDNKIYAGYGNSNLGSTGVSVTTGQWYRLDIKINASSNPHTIDVQVNGTSCGQASNAVASASATNISIGISSANTCNAFYDDVIISNTSGDYPIGAGHVLGYVANADGSHTSTGSDIVKGTTAAPTGGGSITSSTTDAFNWINARPILGGATDNTRLINQQTAASTEYAEFDFEPSNESTAPRSVEVLVVDRQAATQSGVSAIKLNDNGTEDVIVSRNGSGVTSDRFTTKQYATMVGGGAWTDARFDALKIRFGYSSDATPDQYFRGAIIEAEFSDVSNTVPGSPTGSTLSSLGAGKKN